MSTDRVNCLLQRCTTAAFFTVEKQGYYQYTFEGWADHSASWQHEIALKIKDGQHVNVELLVGADLLDEMVKQAKGDEKKAVQEAAKLFRDANRYADAVQMAMSFMMNEWVHKFPLKQPSRQIRHHN